MQICPNRVCVCTLQTFPRKKIRTWIVHTVHIIPTLKYLGGWVGLTEIFSDTYDQIVNADGCLRGRKWVRSEIPKYLWMLMFTWGFA